MLKRVLQRLTRIMTKTVEEQKPESSELHSVLSGRVEKAAAVAHDGTQEVRKRVKVGKYAMMVAYQGKNFFGMQLQKDHPTIESHLLDAMVQLKWITPEMRAQPILFHFQRAARTDRAVSAVRQVCGMQLPISDDYDKTGASQMNEHLPKDIHVVGMRRTTAMFHPQKMCDFRTYSYTLPTFAFAKPHELTNGNFRITEETIAEVDSLLDIYLGTHNFFNYTSKISFDDQSARRYIKYFKCGKPFMFRDELRQMDVEFITITVQGQSFILHQIRKMIGMVITVTRELQLKSYIQKSFERQRIDVPKAPGLGLLLERVHYQNYDRKFEKSHQPLTNWGEQIEADIEGFKFDFITKEILETEIMQQSMLKWLADLVHHDFAANPEAEDAPSKSFVTMAAAQAAKAKEENGSGDAGSKEVETNEAKADETATVVKEEAKDEEETPKQEEAVAR